MHVPFQPVLALYLLLLSGLLLLAIGCQLGSLGGSAFAVVLFLLYFLYSTSGGLLKSFAFPLLFGGVYLMGRGNFVGMAALLGFQSLLYPLMLLNSLALAGVSWWRTWHANPGRGVWQRLVGLGVGVGLGVFCWPYMCRRHGRLGGA